MSSLKAGLIAALLGAAAVFAIVAGAFTATSNTEPAEAHCFDVTCLIELLTMDPCENNVESTFLGSDCCVGDVSTSFFGNQCCQTQIDPPSLVDAALLNGCCETQVNTAIFGSQCCEEVVTGETSAALFSGCCEEGPTDTANATSAIFDFGCECPPLNGTPTVVGLGSGDMLSRLFLNGILTLLGLEQPCELQSLP